MPYKKAFRIIAISFIAFLIVVRVGYKMVRKYQIEHAPTIEIDLNKYTIITIDGGNGWAEAYGSIDWEQIANDYPGQIHTKPGTIYMFPDTGMWHDLRSSVDVVFDKDTDLKNGDILHYNYRILQSGLMNIQNVKYTYKPDTYEVSGLVDPEPFDAFDGLEITFEGKNGEGKVVFNYKGKEEFIQNYQYSAQNDGSLSNGEQIVIYFDNTYHDLVNYNKLAPITEYEVTVGGLEENE